MFEQTTGGICPWQQIFSIVITVIIFLSHIKEDDEGNETTSRDERKPGAGCAHELWLIGKCHNTSCCNKQSGRLIRRWTTAG